MSIPLIETRNLKKYFRVPKGQLHAVDNVSLSIEKGETLGVVGESGCGKSTLGRTILYLHKPTDGSVLYNGEDIGQFSKQKLRHMRTKMQIIFQDPYSSLNPRMTVQELIAEPMLINKTYPTKSDVYKRVEELMEIVGLAPRLATSYPHEMDGGRLQRVGIARTLSLNPEFIVCDEPVSALDVSIQAQILNLLMKLQKDLGLSYMFITHDLSVVKHISDHIAVMYMGVCVERASSKELFKNPMHPYTKALLSAIPVPSLEARNKKPEIIRGEVSSPVNPEPGCRFAPRCKYAEEACRQEDSALSEIAPGHFVACKRIHEI
ncbi:MAG: ATP-binding cassette domain-containing protein [Oscillospiraceae bacterium]